MTVTWHQEYPNSRILARSGQIDIGAVFPPLGKIQSRNPWTWSLWVNGRSWSAEGVAKTETDARDALQAAWQAFLTAADLKQAGGA
ncbi:hypothetical protein [Paracoccus sp. ME4]|uniref:hypothetical protein n=1 Tax=Paracoccus sp. ME4 TaxID=3138066 RepID=UPI00398AB4B7